MTTAIFISYSRTETDTKFVDQLEAELSKSNFDTWVDRLRLQGGDSWEAEIEKQIAQRDIFIVVLSPDSVAPDSWVRNEILFAVNKKKTIIPILSRATPRDSIEHDTIPLC